MNKEESTLKLEKFCAELRQAREFHQMTLKDVSEISKISETYLAKLESGEWNVLPAPYIRSFLKTYAQIVKLNASESLKTFDSIYRELFQPKKKTPLADGTETSESSLPPETELLTSGQNRSIVTDFLEVLQFSFSRISSRAIYWTLGVIGAIALVVIILFIAKATKTEVVEETPFTEIIHDFQEPVSEVEEDTLQTVIQAPPHEKSPPVEESPPQSHLSLSITAKERCYLRLYADGDTVALADIMISPQRTFSYEADSLFKVILGSAGDVTVELNGKDLGILGKQRQVATVTLDKNGIRKIWRGKVAPLPEEVKPDTIGSPADKQPGFDL